MERRPYYDVLGKISDVGAQVNELVEEIAIVGALSVPFVVVQAASSIVARLVDLIALFLSQLIYRHPVHPTQPAKVIYLVRKDTQ